MSFGKSPSSSVNQKAKKQEIADKVKEIKERQKNWLKQRDQHIKDGPPPENYLSSADSYSKNNKINERLKPQINKINDRDGRKSKKPDIKDEISPTVQPKGKFKLWLDTREKAKSEKENLDQRIDTALTYVVDADVLKVDSTRSSGYATPDTSYGPYEQGRGEVNHFHGYDGYRNREESAEKLLSHQDFSAMADDIVARVKNDLNIRNPSSASVTGNSENRKSKSNVNTSQNIGNSKFQEVAKNRSVPSIKSTDSFNSDSDVDMSSHYCPSCQNLMTSPDHIPMIYIPCGHNICQSCCQERQLCPSCGGRPSSKTCNIMLLQIIQDYHGKSSHSYSKGHKVTHGSRSYSPENYRDIKPDSGVKTKSQYKEEYQNLLTRQSVLNSEATDVQRNIKTITHEIKQEEKQIYNIVLEENKVREQIQNLQEKLVALEHHRKQYTVSKEDMNQRKVSESNRLNLIQDTLLTLEIEIEKVKLLSEGR